MTTSKQQSCLYLKDLFSNLDKQWIQNLVDGFPSASHEFLTEQCIARASQIQALEELNRNRNSNHDHSSSDNEDVPLQITHNNGNGNRRTHVSNNNANANANPNPNTEVIDMDMYTQSDDEDNGNGNGDGNGDGMVLINKEQYNKYNHNNYNNNHNNNNNRIQNQLGNQDQKADDDNNHNRKHNDNNKHENDHPDIYQNRQFSFGVLPPNSDDELIMSEKVTDEGPSATLLSSVPEPLQLVFEEYCADIHPFYRPGLTEIVMHLEMMKYNLEFSSHSQSNLNNRKQQKPLSAEQRLIICTDFIVAKLQRLILDSANDAQRLFQRSDKDFQSRCQILQGSEALVKYCGWNFVSTNNSDEDGLFVFNNEEIVPHSPSNTNMTKNKTYVQAILGLLQLYIRYLQSLANGSHTSPNNNQNAQNLSQNSSQNSAQIQKPSNMNSNANANANSNSNHNRNTHNNGNNNNNNNSSRPSFNRRQSAEEIKQLLSIFEMQDNQQNNNNNRNNSNKNSRLSRFLSSEDNEDMHEEKDVFMTLDYQMTRQNSSDVDIINNIIADENQTQQFLQSLQMPTHLNVDQYMLERRYLLNDMNRSRSANANANANSTLNPQKNYKEHQWPDTNLIPGYALMKENKSKGINTYEYNWDSFPDHNWRFIAFEIEMNKFSRIHFVLKITGVPISQITIFGDNANPVSMYQATANAVHIEIVAKPFQKRILCSLKYSARNRCGIGWEYKGRKLTLADISEYVSNSDEMFQTANRKYYELFKQFKLHTIANKLYKLQDILYNRLKVKCFIDMEFPPLQSSLISKSFANHNNRSVQLSDIQGFEGLIWKRSLDLTRYANLFGPLILPTDIQQQSLGNCGFAASLSAIAKYPRLIKRLFKNTSRHHVNDRPQSNSNSNSHSNRDSDAKISEIGMYEIQLCRDGIWTDFTIDDCIPCSYYGQPAFSIHESRNIIWVQLLEKCAAKMYGGYDRLIAMCKLNAFNDLTGYPVEEIRFAVFSFNFNKLWEHLLEWSQNDSIVMSTGAFQETAKKNIADLGIKGNHAFTIVRAVEVEALKLVCVRNPWGSFTSKRESIVSNARNYPPDRWKGAFSRNAISDWTQALVEIVQPGLENNDGTFWMKFYDFLDYFRSASICHLCLDVNGFRECRIQTNIQYTYDEPSQKEDIHFPRLILTIDRSSGSSSSSANARQQKSLDLAWIGVHQPDLRSQYTTYTEYLDCCVMIAKILNSEYPSSTTSATYLQPIAITECRKSRSEFQQIHAKLDDGKYLLIPYTSGIVFHKNFEHLKKQQKRNVNISVFVQSSDQSVIPDSTQITLRNDFRKPIKLKELKEIMIQFMETLGKKTENGDMQFSKASFGTLLISTIRHVRFDAIVSGTFSFRLTNLLPAIGFDQGFILQNAICKIAFENDRQQKQQQQQNSNNNIDSSAMLSHYLLTDSPPKKWEWIYALSELKCMETEIMLFSQFEKGKAIRYSMKPFINYGAMQQSFVQSVEQLFRFQH